ncbi:MAG TPA: FAD-dependent oxidoreductase [Candidatus Saccharimonadales bacterium]|jgi:pyruvate/2-oxoglutarate dehydrogenase complex dihydrolipoamide dehydrogenase (E3) component|nr:FAD-dependent oxidoreductase [Candidatus Saccharimonadales bacterium]
MSEQTSYDLAVIGTGPSGVCAAGFGARLGARVVLIDMSASRKASGYFFGGHQVDTIGGKVSLMAHHQLKIGTRLITAKKIIIVGGSKAHIPASIGVKKVAYYTSDTLHELAKPPRHLVILGGGPTGVIQAFAFATRGSRVSLIEHNSHILSSVDADARQLVVERLRLSGVTIYASAIVPRLTAKGKITNVHISQFNAALELSTDAVLIATGRVPLLPTGLRAAGVHKNDRGILVNDHWQTTNHDIYAIGESVAAPTGCEQAAEQATLCALGGAAKTWHVAIRPYVLQVSPTVAQVGPTETWLQLEDVAYSTYHLDFSDIDDADHGPGFIKVLVGARGNIISATIAGQSAGELIGYFAGAIEHSQKLSSLHTLPIPTSTIASGIRQIALQAYFDEIDRPSWSWRLLHTLRAKI